ncbi:uncharacterized protein PAC_19783 [Phialocephala subalpina]|uniref:Uncharacterized protein n=1 Tax=Phialocephala subalpina TaxID=576137 RepID=A0A1L7XXT5_9HELO|nr:uncharacterized protein PAC_19783 [Phialocephala subalpina]
MVLPTTSAPVVRTFTSSDPANPSHNYRHRRASQAPQVPQLDRGAHIARAAGTWRISHNQDVLYLRAVAVLRDFDACTANEAALLRQSSFNAALLEQGLDLDIERIRKGNITHLCALFSTLVRRLPKDITLICIIDGISHYEVDEHEKGMLKALQCLLDLARDNGVAAVIKVLATSPTTTGLVQGRFEDDDEYFLSLAEVRDTGQRRGLGESDDSLENSDDSDEVEESEEEELADDEGGDD